MGSFASSLSIGIHNFTFLESYLGLDGEVLHQQYFWEAFIQEFGIESLEVDGTVRSTVANDLQWLNAYKNALQAAHEESTKVESCCNRHCNEPTVAFVFNEFDLAHNHTVASITHLLDPSGARIPYEMLKKYWLNDYFDAPIEQSTFPVYIEHVLALHADILVTVHTHRKVHDALENEYTYSWRPHDLAYWGLAYHLIDEYDVLITPVLEKLPPTNRTCGQLRLLWPVEHEVHLHLCIVRACWYAWMNMCSSLKIPLHTLQLCQPSYSTSTVLYCSAVWVLIGHFHLLVTLVTMMLQSSKRFLVGTKTCIGGTGHCC